MNTKHPFEESLREQVPLAPFTTLGIGGPARFFAEATSAQSLAGGVRFARAGALRPGVRERDAADVIHALMSPEVFQLLVGDRGWQPQRYERWLSQTLVDQLLPRS